MSEGTIVFVHGTGTRLADYQPAFRNVAAKLKQYRLDYELVSCEWGDALGARFDGLSLPDLAVQELDDNDVQWYYLFDDPFHNLRPYTIRGSTNSADSSAPGTMPRGLRVWTTVSQYRPSPEFLELLKVSDLLEFWPQAWSFIIKESDIPSRAYSESGNESPDVSYELARSLVAELSNLGRQAGYCGPGHKLRDQMVDRLIVDWGENVFGLGNLL